MRDASRINSSDRPKFWAHRVCAPGDTLAHVRPYLADMGITRVADITGLDYLGVPVAQAVRPMGRSLSVSQGKGLSREAALTSAAMESIEVWHAEFMELPATVAPVGEVGSASMGELCLSDYGGETGPGRAALTWVEGVDLIGGGPLWVPVDLVSMDFVRRSDWPALPVSSNGLASGNTWAEALASGLHEVAERDCIAAWTRWSDGHRGRRRINSSALAAASDTLAELVGRIAAAGLELHVTDLTNDLAVPCYRAKLLDLRPRFGQPIQQPSIGTGAHLDPETAVIRAITEAAQSRLTKIAGSRDDLDPSRYEPIGGANLLAVASSVFDQQDYGFAPFDRPDLSGTTAAEDVATLISLFQAAGTSRLAAVDLTQARFGIPVARIVAPQLGYMAAPGRWTVREGAVFGLEEMA